MSSLFRFRVASSLIVSMTLLGAGCTKTLPSQIATSTIPQIATSTVEENQSWMTSFSYDKIPDGLAQYSLPKAVAQQIINTQSCAPLRVANQEKLYLPLNFSEPVQCEVYKQGPDTVVIGVGFGIPNEGYPSLGSMKMVLNADTFTNEYREIPELKIINDQIYRQYGEAIPSSPEFTKNSQTIRTNLRLMITDPSEAVQKALLSLKN